MSPTPDTDHRPAGAEATPPPTRTDDPTFVDVAPGPDETVPDDDRSDPPSTSDGGGDSDPSEAASTDPEAPGQH